MRRSSSPNVKRAPSPFSATAPISHSRSLPTTLGEDHRPPSSSGIFRRVVSDRVRQAVEGMKQNQPQEAEEPVMVSPRKGARRKNYPKNVDLSDENSRDRAGFKSPSRRTRNRDDLVSPTSGRGKSSRKQPPLRNVGPEYTTEDQDILRKSLPAVNVKIEPQEADLDNVAALEKNSRPMRQRAAGLFASLPTSFPFAGKYHAFPDSSNIPLPQQPVRRLRNARVTVAETPDSSQLLMDIIMWRDFAKSTLIFGVGAFFILSLSFTKDMHFNIVTMTSYAALMYLSIVFVTKNIIQRCSTPYTWTLNEGTAVEMIRGVLPAINSVLRKLSQLFSGDPTVTLKVAGVLWFLAQAGYYLSVWNLMCLAFFAAFTIPILYSSYSGQLQEHGNQICSSLLSTWENCAHKKVVGLVILLGLWNFCSISARLLMVFLSVVAIRKYQMFPANDALLVSVKQEN